MFPSSQSSPNGPSAFAGAYQKIGVETGVGAASPHQLVTMLFDGFNEAVGRAKRAMLLRDIEGKCKAITHAARIIDEGLRAPLNAEAGGKLALELKSLYGYVTLRLTQANLHNDVAALDECLRLIEPVRSAWIAIGPRADAGSEVQ
jgi:flagellar secretion chaperone FliS